MFSKTIPNIILTSLTCVLIAVAAAFGIKLIHKAVSGSPETAVILVAAYLVTVIIIPLICVALFHRKLPSPEQVGFYLLLAVSLALLAIYFYWISAEVFFPADILIWSESDFVSSLIKIATGYPFFTAEALNESNNYTPGAPALAYLIARLFGQTFSLPFYRILHLTFVLIASILAVLCTNLMLEYGFPGSTLKKRSWWNALWFTLLFLIGVNPITNPFVHNLHNEALALMLLILSYLWLILYAKTGKWLYLTLMAITPALGFWVKQYLAIWVVFYTGYLLVFDDRRSIKRALLFGLASAILLVISISLGFLIWKADYFYWVFTVIYKHGSSPLRMVQNLLQVWPYALIGLLCGLLLVWEKRDQKLLGLWLVWLLLFLQEAFTSGVGWMLHHMGPGSLIAGIWMCLAIYLYWPPLTHRPAQHGALTQWSRIGILVVCFVLLANGLGFLRIPVDSLGEDAYRYINQIEQEFEGLAAEKILLDTGSWVYIKDQIIMKDRAVSIGDRGFGGIGDFSGFIDRIEHKAYDKILLRKYLQPDNWYDNAGWPRSSGIFEALQENYRVVRVIPPVRYNDNYLFSEISVLAPK